MLTIRWGSSKSSTSTLLPGLTLPADIGATYNETTTTDVWDYGVPVKVTRPSDNETCDFPEFFQRTMDTFDKPFWAVHICRSAIAAQSAHAAGHH